MSLVDVLENQAKFNVAMQLGSSPSTKVNCDLIKFVPFVTMYRNNFDNAIKESSSLFSILECHLSGSALASIQPYIF